MLAELLGARAATTPDAPAFVTAGRATLSFADWDRRSGSVAAGLRRWGVGPGDRVVLRFDAADFADLAVAAAGVHKAGGVMVPVPVHASVVELARVVRHSAAAAVLSRDELPDLEGQGGSGGAAPTPPPGADAGPVEVSYRLRPLRAAEASTHRAEEVLAVLANLDAGPAWPERSGGAPATSMLHTSAVGTDVARWALWFPLGPGRGPVVTVPGADPDRLCALTAAHQVARWALDPLVAALVLDTGAADGHDLSSLVQVVLAGGPSEPALLSRLAARLPSASILTVGDGGREPSPVVDEPDAAPLAPSQEGMLWQEQLVPGSQNLPPLVRRYRGPLDLDVLGRALTEIVRRHEPLRTTFALRGGEPVQVVFPTRALTLDVRDLTGRPGDEQGEEMDRFLEEARRPLDLVEGPLFEPTVFRLGPDDHVVVFRVHHSVYDDWSVGVFRRELSALYAAIAAGRPPRLPEVPGTFRDFARAQRRRLEGEAGTRELAWWKQHLAGAPLALQLPVDDPSLPAGAPQASPEPVTVRLPAAVHAQLQAFARRERATVFTTVLAATAALLRRYTDQSELLLASVVANRNRVELEGMVGCFTKKVLLRVDVGGDPTFGDLLKRARSALLGALSHQDLAFEAVLQEVLGRAAAASGVVPQPAVMVQGVTPAAGDVVLPGLATEGYDTSATTRRTHFAAAGGSEDGLDAGPPWGTGVYLGTFVILSVVEAGDELSLVARGAFWRPAVEALLADLTTLVAGAVAHPSRPVSELASGDAERGRPAGEDLDLERDLHQLFHDQVARNPSGKAVGDAQEVLSFAELDARADSLAARLRDAGVGAGAFVGVGLPASVDCVVAVLAVWKVGAAYVGLDPADEPGHLASVLERARIEVVLAPPGAAGGVVGPGPRRLAVRDGGPHPARPATDSGGDARPGAPALAFYGCGATEVPSGVVLDHRAVGSLLAGLRQAVHGPATGATGRDRLRVGLSAAPTEDAFLRQLVALLDGHTLVVFPPGAGPALSGVVDLVDCTPSQLPDLEGADPPVVVLGSRVPIERDEVGTGPRPASVVHHLFGPPECGFAATSELAAEGRPRLTIGRPLAHVTAEVLGASGSPVPVQVPGELHLAGAGLARGVGQPQPTRHPTGLVARRLPDGRIEVLGSVAGNTMLRGLRIDRSRIEAALARHPAVRQVTVTVEGADQGDPHLAARVVPAGGELPTLAELRVHLWRELPGCPWPGTLVISDAAGSEVAGPGTGSPTAEERLLAGLWAEVLGVDAVPVETNYWQRFSFLEAIARAREAGLRVADRQVSRNRTIAGLAADLAASR